MLPLVVLVVFSLLSKNSAEQWLMNYKYDTDSAEEGNINNFNNDDYNNYDFDDYDSGWDQMEHDIQLLEDTNSLEIRGLPSAGHMRKNRQGCRERTEVYEVPKSSIHDEIYPKKYRNITCEPAEGHDITVYPLCHVYNPKCETAHREVPIFKKYVNSGKTCWKYEATIHVQTGCKCPNN
ncbi:uncharacterized protein LOC123013363 [Tribolium madens]|uniref:uncharacterized protein LOC123013363 n=1 Tax=Tribolium madens TaxID=41895 RepID=UPI001CF74127|nr:uncharacterized protein LOC123013363 [Tribolium madens]